MRLGKLLSLICAAVLLVPAASANAAYPEKNITMVVPFAPGGGNDRISRCLDKHSTLAFGKSFVFEYKEGAGGLIGSAYLETLKADGYALGNVNAPQIYLYATQKNSPFRVDKLTYLFQLSTEPMALVTPKNSPIKTWADYLAYCKKNPGKMSVGLGSGFNSSAGYTSLVMQKELGITFNRVPLKGGADLTVNLLGNHVMSGIGNLSVVLNEKDKLNFIAVTSGTRNIFVPDVPTFKELGVNVVDQVRRLVVAPAGVNKKLQAEMIKKFKAVFDTKAMHDEMMRNGWAPDWIEGDELTKVISADFEKFRKVMGK